MKQTALDRYASKGSDKGGQYFSRDDEVKYCLLWQNHRDEKALEQLIIDKALLVRATTQDIRQVFKPLVSVEDIDQWALEGIQKGVEAYPAGTTDISLNTYVTKGARWNIFREIQPYLQQNVNLQRKADKLLHEESERQQRELTYAEEERILGTLSPSLKATFYRRQIGSTQTASGIARESWVQHPSTDDQPELQWTSSDPMDNFPSSAFPGPYEALEQDGLRDGVKALLDELTPRERRVLVLRYGVGLADRLSSDESKPTANFMTLNEVSAHFDVGPERIRQIECKALRKLRNPMRSGHMAIYAEGDIAEGLRDLDIQRMEDEAFELFLEHSAEPV